MAFTSPAQLHPRSNVALSRVRAPVKALPASRGPRASPHASASVPRRILLQRLVAAALGAVTASATSGTGREARAQVATGEKVVNSILSGYGLPTLRERGGFTPLVQQYGRLVVEFQFPSSWIVARNTAPRADANGLVRAGASVGAADAPLEGRGSGLTVGDYRKAEGLAFYVAKVESKGVTDVRDVPTQFITELVTPGDATGTASEARVVKDFVDDDGFRRIETKYESTTVSGYTVERRGRTRATMLSDGKVYALTGSCTEIRLKKVGDTINTALASFQVFRL